MAFLQPCFIRLNTPEIIEEMKIIGYQPLTSQEKYSKYEYLYVTEGYDECIDSYPFFSGGVMEQADKYFANREDIIDCGDNIKLFMAIAALSDDTDYGQYFVLECNWCIGLSDNATIIPKGSLVKCQHDKWFVDTDSLGNPCIWSSRNVPSHKASVQELIENLK